MARGWPDECGRRVARGGWWTFHAGVAPLPPRRVSSGSIASPRAPIIVDGTVWGLVTIASTDGPLPDQAEGRLAEFTELVGTAIANTQSRAELSASRARIVAAADETRRRLERDLHDGIQQRLVSLALKARTIETMTPRPADEIQGELSLLADGLGTAMDELREISHGIHPAILSEAGLGPALEALARRSAVPVELDLNLGPRLSEHVEAAGYYIASEAITNVAKHAQASVIDMRADGCDGALYPLDQRRWHRRRRPEPRLGHHRPQRPGRGPRRNDLGPEPARPRNSTARPASGRSDGRAHAAGRNP